MNYESFSDYMLDNRNALADKLKGCETSEQLISEALDGYDWAVSKGIEHLEWYKMLKEAIIKEYGEEKFSELERRSCEDLLRIPNAVSSYYSDVAGKKKVGYSAGECSSVSR